MEKINNKKCPLCLSIRTTKHQKVTTKKQQNRQRYKCQNCGSTFYEPSNSDKQTNKGETP